MITLPDVTLFAIDCFKPTLTAGPMMIARNHIEFGDTVLLTDTNKHNLKLPGFRIVHHTERDIRVPCPRADHYPLPLDYEQASLREPALHIHTNYLLFMEWDSGVLNPWAWNNEWLSYDFIGAPWAAHLEPGWPHCDGHTNNVGNFGFSLRSAKFCEATRRATELFKDDPKIGPGMISSDMWACRTIRPWLEEQGIRFAPEHVAARFSCENHIYSGQFGYHGQWTAQMNNWGGVYAGVRPKY